MKRKPLFNALAIALTTSGLVACGGGGGDDTTTTSTTSSKTIVGTLTGFGSVYVNGIEFDTSSSSFDVDDDSSTADQSDLAVGMLVRVEGSVNDDGVSGTATSIYYDDDVEGPIDTGSLVPVDATTKTFTVLGLDVMVDANTTVFDDVTFDTLAEGDVVEVSGTFDGDYIVATRIEKQSDTDQDYELKGTVVNYDGSSISLTLLNGMAAGPYDASGASVEGTVSSGVFVEVKLRDDGAGLSATAIEVDDADSLVGDEEDVSIHGLISGDSASGFLINTTPFSVNDSTVYEPTTLEGTLAAGMEVEVEGYMQDGTLIATKVESEHEGEDEIELEARVSSVTATDSTTGSITLDMDGTNTLTVQTDTTTLFEDDSSSDSDGDGSFTLSELTSTDFVEVDAYWNGTDLVAAKLKRTDSIEATTLKAPVEAVEPGISVTLLGITYTMDSSTSYDVDDVSTTSTLFFEALDVGERVEIKDVEPDGTAEEADLDQTS
jgi:hypothetical protein